MHAANAKPASFPLRKLPGCAMIVLPILTLPKAARLASVTRGILDLGWVRGIVLLARPVSIRETLVLALALTAAWANSRRSLAPQCAVIVRVTSARMQKLEVLNANAMLGIQGHMKRARLARQAHIRLMLEPRHALTVMPPSTRCQPLRSAWAVRQASSRRQPPHLPATPVKTTLIHQRAAPNANARLVSLMPSTAVSPACLASTSRMLGQDHALTVLREISQRNRLPLSAMSALQTHKPWLVVLSVFAMLAIQDKTNPALLAPLAPTKNLLGLPLAPDVRLENSPRQAMQLSVRSARPTLVQSWEALSASATLDSPELLTHAWHAHLGSTNYRLVPQNALNVLPAPTRRRRQWIAKSVLPTLILQQAAPSVSAAQASPVPSTGLAHHARLVRQARTKPTLVLKHVPTARLANTRRKLNPLSARLAALIRIPHLAALSVLVKQGISTLVQDTQAFAPRVLQASISQRLDRTLVYTVKPESFRLQQRLWTAAHVAKIPNLPQEA